MSTFEEMSPAERESFDVLFAACSVLPESLAPVTPIPEN
jgi:hypothetical protein